MVPEVLSQCLVDLKMRPEQITALDDKTLVAPVMKILDMAKNNLENMGFVATLPDKGPQRDMIV